MSNEINFKSLFSNKLTLSVEQLLKTRDTLHKSLTSIRELEKQVKNIPKFQSVIRAQNKLITELLTIRQTTNSSNVCTSPIIELSNNEMRLSEFNVIHEILLLDKHKSEKKITEANNKPKCNTKCICDRTKFTNPFSILGCENEFSNLPSNDKLYDKTTSFKKRENSSEYYQTVYEKENKILNNLNDIKAMHNCEDPESVLFHINKLSSPYLKMTKAHYIAETSIIDMFENVIENFTDNYNEVLISYSTESNIFCNAISFELTIETAFIQYKNNNIQKSDLRNNIMQKEFLTNTKAISNFNQNKEKLTCRNVSKNKSIFQLITGKEKFKDISSSEKLISRPDYLRKLYSKWAIDNDSLMIDHLTIDPNNRNVNEVSNNQSSVPLNNQNSIILWDDEDFSFDNTDLVSIDQFVSSIAAAVLVDVSEEFENHTLQSCFDSLDLNESILAKNCTINKCKTLIDSERCRTSRNYSRRIFSQSVQRMLFGAYSDEVSSNFINTCYVIQEWLENPAKIGSFDINSVINQIRDDWFKKTIFDNPTPEQFESFFDILQYFNSEVTRHIVNIYNSNGDSFLHLAIENGLWDLVKMSLKKCDLFDLNQFNHLGFTPLMITATVVSQPIKTSEVDVIYQILDKSKSGIVSNNDLKITAFNLAVFNGKTDFFNLLLRSAHFSDVKLVDANGNTALHLAAAKNNWEIVRLLVTHSDISIDLKNNDGLTALDIAKENDNCEIAVLLFVKKSIQNKKTFARSIRYRHPEVKTSLRRHCAEITKSSIDSRIVFQT